MTASPHEGLVQVELRLNEVTLDGRKIQWSPLLLVKRGEPATASVAWGGAGRVLRLTVR